MTYLARHALTNDQEMKKRVQMAVWIAATNIIYEDPQTANHAARVVWAAEKLRGPMPADEERKAMIFISANSTIGEQGNAASDNDIQFVVNGFVDQFAHLEAP